MKNGRSVLVGVVLIALLVGAVFYARKVRPVGPLTVSSTDIKAKGPANAPIQIVEYSDFQCPACMQAAKIVREVLSTPEYEGKIHFIFRHYPLPGHRWAGLAHQAAECAHQEGRFWEYHDRLYAEQAAWSILANPMENFLRYAKDLNLPLETFGLCLASPEARKHVLSDKEKGDSMRIQSTPTFFINGERFVGHAELQMQGVKAIRHILRLPAITASPSPQPTPQAVPSPAAS